MSKARVAQAGAFAIRPLLGKMLWLQIDAEKESRDMIVQIGGLLQSDKVNSLRQALPEEAAGFKAGAATAGWHAKEVKKNEQASGPVAAKVTRICPSLSSWRRPRLTRVVSW